MNPHRRAIGVWALAGFGLQRPASAADTDAATFDLMVRLDAIYIPALSLTSAAQGDARAAPRATAAVERLLQAWPPLQQAMAARPPAPAATTAWTGALRQARQQIERARADAARADWAAAHEALEPLREHLMQVRRAAGFEYFIDRLTAFHAPMEVLALAGARAGMDAATRTRLEQAYAEARVRWLEIERHPPDARRHRLNAAREAQLRQGLAGVDAAMARLSDALRGRDDAALVAALRAVKPPFARAFTAFGLAEGETL